MMKSILFLILFLQTSWAQEYPHDYDDHLYESEDYFNQEDDYEEEPHEENEDFFFYESDLYEDAPYEEDFIEEWDSPY